MRFSPALLPTEQPLHHIYLRIAFTRWIKPTKQLQTRHTHIERKYLNEIAHKTSYTSNIKAYSGLRVSCWLRGVDSTRTSFLHFIIIPFSVLCPNVAFVYSHRVHAHQQIQRPHTKDMGRNGRPKCKRHRPQQHTLCV